MNSLTPKWFSQLAHTLALVTGVVALALAAFAPEFYLDYFVLKDGRERTGIAEHLTWIILIPGIILAVVASIRFSSILPHLAKVWLLTWAAACVYFAGEEASWGQWYFHWETPDAIEALNDQQETNFHNTSSWFDQKPRLLVELWILIGGLIIPFIQRYTSKLNFKENTYQYWISVPFALTSCAALFFIVRLCDWSEIPVLDLFGMSEYRELTIALFLTLYLASFWVRLSQLSAKNKS